MAYKFQSELAILSGAISPSNDDAFDIGAASKQYKDLYIDGVAYIDVLGADADPTTAYIGGGEIDATVIGGETPAAGTFTDLVANGNVDLGDAATDSVTVTGRFDSDLLPIADSTSDLGSSALQWAELHVDVGYVDQLGAALDANSQAITNINVDSGAIDGTTIGANAQSSVKATTLSASSNVDVDGNMQVNGSVINFPKLLGLTSAGSISGSDFFMALDATSKDVIVQTRTGLVGEMAGDGLADASGVLSVDLNELSAGAIASGDSFAFVDSDDSNASKKETVDDLATLFAGNGLSAASAVMALDLNELTAATVDVANDSIAIIDADDSNSSKKESIADLVSGMAGAGLTATDGVLSSDASPVPSDHGDADATLAEGMNWSSATFTSSRTWTLPASPDSGDVVSVKAPTNASAQALVIARAGSQTIDGMTQIVINSDNGAVDLVYAGSDKWLIK